MRALTLASADLVLVTQAGPVGEWPDALYKAEMHVACLQNGYYVAPFNRIRHEDRLAFSGESFVCGPDGAVVARAGLDLEEILYAGVDLASTASSHDRLLFLRHRQPRLFGEWLTK